MPADDFEVFGRARRGNVSWEQLRGWVSVILIGSVLLLILLACFSMVYRVEASDEGVVLRFGEKVATVPPGLHFKMPWPVDTVYKVPVQRIQSLEFGFETTSPGRKTRYAPQTTDSLAVAEMLTGDLNLGHVEWVVQYRVKDPMNFLFKVGSTEKVERLPSGTDHDVNAAVPDTISDVSESVVRKLVGDSSIDYVLTIGREQLAKEAETLIQEELDGFEAGIEIITVKLQTTSPPTTNVQDAFQEVNRARQKKEQVVNEAIGERNSKIPAARGAKDKAIAEAEGYENRAVLETNGQVNAFLAQLTEYQIAPDVTRKRLFLEAMEEVLTNAGGKTIIDESVKGVLPVLNLNQDLPPPALNLDRATPLPGFQGGRR
ncbi:MAG: FtsH protease activity modulator HflK [Pirellulaceae bacterium]|jgi:membrane protease subunit HflK|nr:FtsH protease activity modulator HflK [Pirellulaceae bacterium]MDP7016486.1 FtsH protease activity modulator HflK [Pirellulaceae bacterium]